MSALAAAVDARLAAWAAEGFVERLWAHDASLWAASGTPVEELGRWLGWLDLPEQMPRRVGALTRLAREVRADGYTRAAVLGMGGSSLAPDLCARLFLPGPGDPELRVLDTTHPDAVRAFVAWARAARTLLVVSSKSGTTAETLAFQAALAEVAPALDFVVITDPGTPLADLARAMEVRAIVEGQPDVGGRYSALSPFGLLPMALLGIDLDRLLFSAASMAGACHAPPADNPGLRLGAFLGEAALAGRDKLTLVVSTSLGGLAEWIEQLVAESTGKAGRGILPVVGEPLGAPDAYGADRAFVGVGLAGEEDPADEALLTALEQRGHPVLRLRLPEPLAIGGEFVRWEIGVAVAGALMGINPFDQPNVTEAKAATGALLEAYRRDGHLPEPDPMPTTVAANAPGNDAAAVRELLASLRAGDYLAILAYAPPEMPTADALDRIRVAVRDRLRVATTAGIGPRYLHSTGQLHKGGPNTGAYLLLTVEPRRDLPIPGAAETFGTLIRAQALGDLAALRSGGRRVAHLHLPDPTGGLARVEELVDAALTGLTPL